MYALVHDVKCYNVNDRAQVDWNLIGWFTGTFIVVVTFGETDLTVQLWAAIIGTDVDFTTFMPLVKLTVTVLALSNIVSNVPLILLLAPDILAMDDPQAQVGECSASPCSLMADSTAVQEYAWIIVAWVSTVAGNLTLVGSAANIIVAELSSTQHLTFLRHLKFGFPVTPVIVVVGLVVLCGSSNVLS